MEGNGKRRIVDLGQVAEIAVVGERESGYYEIVKKKKTRRSRREMGFFQSPFWIGILSLVPIVVLVFVGGTGVLRMNNERVVLHKLGAFPYSTLVYQEVIEESTSVNDYLLAERVYLLAGQNQDNRSLVLGLKSDIEDLIWPERRIEQEIAQLEEMTKEIKSREIYLKLASLSEQIGDKEKMEEYLELAQEVDTNEM